MPLQSMVLQFGVIKKQISYVTNVAVDFISIA